MSFTTNVRLMRKQPLRRKTSLQRKTPLKRRTGLRRMSAGRARLKLAVGAQRRAFLVEFPHCAYPGCGRRSVGIHEIAFGWGIRPKAYSERCTWLPACAWHNQSGAGFHDLGKMPLAHQCALKQLLDPRHYDLPRINVLRGHSPGAISAEEVAGFLTGESLD